MNSAGKALKIEREIRQRLAAGNALSANDLAMAAIEAGTASDAVRYLYLQSLAASGSSRLALKRFVDLAPPVSQRDEDWLALHARLHKDLAFAGIDVDYNLRRAAAEYEIAHQRTQGTFSLINAATLNLLAGNPRVAEEMGRKSLDLLGLTEPRGEQARYFWFASRAEAYLVLADGPAARTQLAQANRLARNNLQARSRTRAQLRRIVRAQGLDPSLPLQIELPNAYVLDAFGESLSDVPACPADLHRTLAGAPAFAVVNRDPHWLPPIQQLIGSGAMLHLAIQADLPQELAWWSEHFSDSASRSLSQMLKGAVRVSAIRGFLHAEQNWMKRQAYRLIYGLAAVQARELDEESELQRIAISNAGWRLTDELAIPAIRRAARGSDDQARRGRRNVGLVFSDLVGFRRFSDEDILGYWERMMPRIAASLDGTGDKILLRQTWGDALHLVTEDAASAIRVAHRLLQCVRELRRELPGRLGSAQIRVGAHYAPAFEGYDPVEQIRTYYGTQLSLAASVEPVTPPGQVFATETCAAALALEAKDEFFVEYAGEVPLAKKLGSFRLYAVHRKS